MRQAFTVSVEKLVLSPKTALAKVTPAVEAELENCGKLGTVAGGSCVERVPLWMSTGDAQAQEVSGANSQAPFGCEREARET